MAGIGHRGFFGRKPGSGVLWTPAEISTELWYDASDASSVIEEANVVTEWHDKSGNERHTTAQTGKEPIWGLRTLNGLNVMDFDSAGGGDRLVALFDAIPQPIQFIVVSSIDLSGNRVFFDSYSSVTFVYYTDAFGRRFRFSAGGATPHYNASVIGHPYVNSLLFHEDLSEFRENAELISAPTSIGANSLSGISLGATRGNPTPINTAYLDGYLGEIVAMSGFNIDNRQKSEGYLAWKWGLEANLPAGHPYESAPPYI